MRHLRWAHLPRSRDSIRLERDGCRGKRYPISFSETGLPTGATWGVDLNAYVAFQAGLPTVTTNYDQTASAGSQITYTGFATGYSPYGVTVPNVVYQSCTYAPTGYPSNYPGRAETITFSLSSCTVPFVESGLASATTWSITLNGHSNSSSTSALSFTKVAAGSGLSLVAGSIVGYSFSEWTATGSISVVCATCSSTTIHVTGPGQVTAVYVSTITLTMALQESGPGFANLRAEGMQCDPHIH